LTQVDYAEFLAHGDEAERVRALDLASGALDAARQFGYPAIAGRAARLLDESGG